MTGGKGRQKGARPRYLSGKTGILCLLACLIWGGKPEVSMASQPFAPPEAGETQDIAPPADESVDFYDFEGDVTEDEMDRALEEYMREMDLDSLIQGGRPAGKVTDPTVRTEIREDGTFLHTLPNGNYFISSVPKGMVTADAVDITLQAGTVGLVSINGEAEVFPDSWHFTEEGTYCVRLLMYQQPGDMTSDYNLYQVPFYFTIIRRNDHTLGIFPPPEGFAIKEVRWEGKPLKTESERGFFLGEDGRYEIVCESLHQEGVLVRTEFVRDTTAPFLSFSKEPGPKSQGPIEFFPSEQNCRIYMNYNGNRGYAAGSVLTAPGGYELSVEDEAGNERIYHIRIRQTYDLADRRIILAALAVLGIGAVRLLILRRDMRVM